MKRFDLWQQGVQPAIVDQHIVRRCPPRAR